METTDRVATRAGDDLLPGMAKAAPDMNSGTCHGGPLDGKPLHHPEPAYKVAIDPYPGRGGPRTIPGMVASADQSGRFGVYRFADEVWTWQE